MSEISDYKIFLLKYFHDGRWWQLEIPAKDHDDAQARLNALPRAQLLGELAGTIPASMDEDWPRLRLLTE